MPLFHTILVAADFSESSRQAFRVACALADERETRLLVVHVIESLHIAELAIGFGAEGQPVVVDEGSPAHHVAVKDALREWYVTPRAHYVAYDVREGDPKEEILHAAAQSGCDLIVMGTHGRTGLRRLLTGSVAESVLREARCAVLALRTVEHAVNAKPSAVILHPVELEEPSDAALRAARALACEQGARLVLFYVAPLDLTINSKVTGVRDIEEYEKSLEKLRARLDGPDLKYPVEARMGRGNVAREILRAAEETACGLIVMGAHGRRGLDRLILGSAAEGVMHGACCPVLVVKEPVAVPAGA